VTAAAGQSVGRLVVYALAAKSTQSAVTSISERTFMRAVVNAEWVPPKRGRFVPIPNDER
jgi:hypothetical protein